PHAFLLPGRATPRPVRDSRSVERTDRPNYSSRSGGCAGVFAGSVLGTGNEQHALAPFAHERAAMQWAQAVAVDRGEILGGRIATRVASRRLMRSMVR